jgi:hypothetical protein
MERSPHFAHEADADCGGALETMLHKLAKQTLADARSVWLPPLVATVERWRKVIRDAAEFIADSVDLEIRAGAIQPDAILRDARTALAVEVYVAHRVSQEKRAEYARLKMPAIEIDLSSQHKRHNSEAIDPLLLPDFILRAAPREWLFSALKLGTEAGMAAWLVKKRAQEAREAEAAAAAIAKHAVEQKAARIAAELHKQRLAQLDRKRAEALRQQEAERVARNAWRVELAEIATAYLPTAEAAGLLLRPTLTWPLHSVHSWPDDDPPRAADRASLRSEITIQAIHEANRGR